MEFEVINSIRGILEKINLGQYQKHEDFHIIDLHEDKDKFPEMIQVRQGDYFEITVAEQSETEVLIDKNPVSLESDIVTFVAPGQSLSVNRTHAEKAGYILFFTVNFLDFSPTIFSLIQRFPYFNINFSPVYKLDKSQSALLFELMKKMHLKFQDPTPDNFEIIKALLTILLFEAKQLPSELIKVGHSRQEEITFHFEQLLKQQEKWTKVKDYADQLHISPIYLSECIKTTTGKSAKSVIIDYKMREAKSLLQFSDKSIDEIGQSVGFEERSNFINFFKKQSGTTPHKFRKGVRVSEQ